MSSTWVAIPFALPLLLSGGCEPDDRPDQGGEGWDRPPMLLPHGPDVTAPPFVTSEATYVGQREAWWVWPHGGELGDAWRQPEWEPAPGWVLATAPLGYGEDYVRPLPQGGDPDGKPVTVYFRRAFLVDDPDQVISLAVDAMFDDGLVFHVNGQEAGRVSMPPESTDQTFAFGHEALQRYEPSDASTGRAALRAGWNTLAVELHQASAISDDLVFDVALRGRLQVSPPPEPAVGGIPRRSQWFYWDRGGDQGTAWRTGADGPGWLHGPAPLGYGEAYLETTIASGADPLDRYVTTYFRQQFVVEDPGDVSFFRGELMYDDGVVIYLNGTEIQRDAMPFVEVDATTLALPHEALGYYRPKEWSRHRHLLVEGVNTIAVELHQAAPASTDLVFDLAVSVE